MKDKNATNTMMDAREEKYREIQSQVMSALHPLVSPYDLSESNLRMQMNTNPYFHKAVKHFSHLMMLIPEPSEFDKLQQIKQIVQFKL